MAEHNPFEWLMEKWPQEKFKIIAMILDSIYDGVLIADEKSIVRYVNPEYTRITGVSSEAIVGRHVTELRPGAVLPTVIKTGKKLEGIYRREGAIEYVVDMAPIVLSGEIVGGVSVVKDVTEARHLMKEVQRYEKKTSNLKTMVRQAYKAQYQFDDILYGSGAMAEVVAVAKRVAQGDSNVLITGESGTGKELVAQAIHNASQRREGPFVALNCAALTSSLAESELFGYEEGAFTGARKGGRMGAFEIADGGTVLLDEVGELSLEIQAKLLRTLQERKVRRVGESAELKVNVRVIACTNRELAEMVKAGQFREDLFYRLNVVNLQLPPLRERTSDISLLAEKFLAGYAQRMGQALGFSPEVAAVLQRHPWPGNIRELANAVEFAANMCEEGRVERQNLPKYLLVGTEKEAVGVAKLDLIVRDAERKAIIECLRVTGADLTGKKQAAQRLGVSLATLYNKIKEYGIQVVVDKNSKNL